MSYFILVMNDKDYNDDEKKELFNFAKLFDIFIFAGLNVTQ